MQRFARLVALLGLAILAACAALPGRLEAPKVSLAGLSLIDAGLFEQRFSLRLRVQNPNDADLPIDGMTYDLELNDKPFGSGVANKPVTVPRYGSELIEVELVTNLAGVLRQFSGLGKGGMPSLRYKLRGNVNVGTYGTRLPFEQSGEVGVPDFGSQRDQVWLSPAFPQ